MPQKRNSSDSRDSPAMGIEAPIIKRDHIMSASPDLPVQDTAASELRGRAISTDSRPDIHHGILETTNQQQHQHQSIKGRHEFVMLYNHLRQCKSPIRQRISSREVSPVASSPIPMAVTVTAETEHQTQRRTVIHNSEDAAASLAVSFQIKSSLVNPTNTSTTAAQGDSPHSIAAAAEKCRRRKSLDEDVELDEEDHLIAAAAESSSQHSDEDIDDDEDGPLDLSLNNVFSRNGRERTFSETESDDSGAGVVDGDHTIYKSEGRAAYKKNLMKRYCK